MANPALIAEFHNIILDEARARDLEFTSSNFAEIATIWCEQYDDVPPKNRAEVHVLDALQALRDRYASRAMSDKLSV